MSRFIRTRNYYFHLVVVVLLQFQNLNDFVGLLSTPRAARSSCHTAARTARSSCHTAARTAFPLFCRRSAPSRPAQIEATSRGVGLSGNFVLRLRDPAAASDDRSSRFSCFRRRDVTKSSKSAPVYRRSSTSKNNYPHPLYL